jgi:hypothetical protein
LVLKEEQKELIQYVDDAENPLSTFERVDAQAADLAKQKNSDNDFSTNTFNYVQRKDY